MEVIRYNPDRAMGIEVLSFEAVELEKIKGGTHSFATIGTLNVIYLRDYLRFVLYLNDWKYVLLDSISITALDSTVNSLLCYSLPTSDGVYLLKLTKISHVEAIQNFESILSHNCNFSHPSRSQTPQLSTLSPAHSSEEFNSKSMTHQEISREDDISVDSLLTMRDEKLRKRDIVKREIIKAADNLSRGIVRRRRINNINMASLRSYEELKSTSEEVAPIVFLWRDDVERTIIESKRYAEKLDSRTNSIQYSQETNTPKSSFVGDVKSRLGFHTESHVRPEMVEKIISHFPVETRNSHLDSQMARDNQQSNLIGKLKTGIELLGKMVKPETEESGQSNENQLRMTLAEKLKSKLPVVGQAHNTNAYTQRAATTSNTVQEVMPRWNSAQKANPRGSTGLAYDEQSLCRTEPSLNDKIKEALMGSTSWFGTRNTGPSMTKQSSNLGFVEKVEGMIVDKYAKEDQSYEVYGDVDQILKREHSDVDVKKMAEAGEQLFQNASWRKPASPRSYRDNPRRLDERVTEASGKQEMQLMTMDIPDESEGSKHYAA